MLQRQIFGTVADASAGGGSAIGAAVTLTQGAYITRLLINVGANPASVTPQHSLDNGATWAAIAAPITLPANGFAVIDFGLYAPRHAEGAPNKQVRLFASAALASIVSATALIEEEELSI